MTIATALRIIIVVHFILPIARAADGPLGGDVIDVVEKGGVVMGVILVLSVIGLALAFERLVALRRGVLVPRSLKEGIEQAAAQGDVEGMNRVVEGEKGPLARMLAAGLRWREHGPEPVESAMESAGQGELAGLKRRVRPLAILATIEPMLGLLGTVLGMIDTFNTLHGTSAAERVAKLAPGIGQALYTTAAGLCTAIPFVLLFHYLNGRANRAAEEWTQIGNEMVLGLRGGPAAAENSGAAPVQAAAGSETAKPAEVGAEEAA